MEWKFVKNPSSAWPRNLTWKEAGDRNHRRDSDEAEKGRVNSVAATLHGATPSSLLNDACKIFTGCGRWGLSGSQIRRGREGRTRLRRETVVARIISIFTTLLFGQAPGGRGEIARSNLPPPSTTSMNWVCPRSGKSYAECVYFCPTRRVLSPGLVVSERRVVERLVEGRMFR